MADFALIAFPGAYQSSVAALVDSYQLARDRVEAAFSGVERVRMETALRVYSAEGRPAQPGSGGFLPTESSLPAERDHAFIWLPSFRIGSPAALHERLAGSTPLLGWLKDQAHRGATIGASGAGAAFLVAAGLTDGFSVPVARALRPLLRSRFPRQRLDERLGFADHGNILISNGFANDLALILRVFDRVLSPEVARWLASVTGLDREEEHVLAADQLVARAQVWIEQHFTQPIRIGDLAALLSTSLATLKRRFHKETGLSPKAYAQKLRMLAAIRMLEKTSRPIDQIAEQLGYSDGRLFRRMFKKHTGKSARQWRAETRSDARPTG